VVYIPHGEKYIGKEMWLWCFRVLLLGIPSSMKPCLLRPSLLGRMNLEKISEFLSCLEERFGVYLDATQGFILNYTRFLESQQWVHSQHEITIEQQDQAFIIRSNHPPSPDLEECSQREKHRMTQKQYKENNRKGGLNHRITLEDCLCAIFNQWDEFKKYVLKKQGLPDSQVMPVMVYLKAVRDRLTHMKDHPEEGKFVSAYSLKYLEYKLPSFTKDQIVELSSDDLDAVVVEIRGWIRGSLSPVNAVI